MSFLLTEKVIRVGKIEIEPVKTENIEQILKIYGYYVKNTAITFEYEIPSYDEMRRRIEMITVRYPFLVARCDGMVVGYGYACAFHERPAYQWCVEMSIYVADTLHHQGIGKQLYQELERILQAQHITNLLACIAMPITPNPYVNENSRQFHQYMGYQEMGRFHHCGYKFGQWFDVIWMEKIIADHCDQQADVIDFPLVKHLFFKESR